MFSNLFSGATLYIILALLASTAGFGYLSYSLSNDKAVAVAQLKDANNAILEYQKQAQLKDLSCKIDDSISTEYQVEKNQSDQVKDSELSKIDKLPLKVKPSPIPSQAASSNESNVVNIDDELPADLRRLLTESYNRAKGSVGADSRPTSN